MHACSIRIIVVGPIISFIYGVLVVGPIVKIIWSRAGVQILYLKKKDHLFDGMVG